MNRTLFRNLPMAVTLLATTAHAQSDLPPKAGSASKNEIDIRHAQTEVVRGQLHLGGQNSQGSSIEFNSLYMQENGQPVLPVMGEFHYVRTPAAEWDESLKKIKAAGINIVSTYVFWNLHEEIEGQFEWTGDKDLRKFVQLCGQNGLQVIVRLGPFCHGEIRNGGLPDWLYGRPFNVRSNDAPYLRYVERLYGEIGKQLVGLLFKDGGPVIGFQLENELHHSAAPWAFSYPGQPPEWTNADEQRYFAPGVSTATKKDSYAEEGRQHMASLLELAHKCGLDAPLYTATGWGNAAVVENATIPVTSAYPFPTWEKPTPSPLYLYRDLHQQPDYSPVSYQPLHYPSFGAELGGGIMITYSRRPTVSARSIESLVIRELGGGANAIGYYMFHGGATPRGKKSFMSEEPSGVPKISYDFQAPIGEYGQLAESYGYLKLIHFFLNDFGSQLAPMVSVLPENAAAMKPKDVDQLRFAVRTRDDGGFVFLHNYQDHVPMHELVDQQITLQTKDGVLQIPADSSFTLKSETATFFPFNFDFGGVRVRYATAQPLATLAENGKSCFAFAAVEGIPPEFAFQSKLLTHFKSDDCQAVAIGNNLSVVRCAPDKISEFTVDNDQGQPVTFVVFPKSMALHAWRIATKTGRRLAFSEATLLERPEGVEVSSIGNNAVSLAVYPALPAAPKYDGTALSVASAPHRSMSAYTWSFPEVEPFIHAKVADRKTLTLSSDKAALPEGINDVFLDIDYVGDTGLAFINGELVDDGFYFGQPWRIGLRRFLSRLAADGMYFSFRPIDKNAPFLADLPTSAVPNFANQNQVLQIKQVRVLPEYHGLLEF
ncbi:MAG TPA: beta-galactosidase [Pirellulales bacterium]|jgi:hypothetical protein|nr:beta-galactosidase [Pirellulales bacterium]